MTQQSHLPIPTLHSFSDLYTVIFSHVSRNKVCEQRYDLPVLFIKNTGSRATRILGTSSYIYKTNYEDALCFSRLLIIISTEHAKEFSAKVMMTFSWLCFYSLDFFIFFKLKKDFVYLVMCQLRCYQLQGLSFSSQTNVIFVLAKEILASGGLLVFLIILDREKLVLFFS